MTDDAPPALEHSLRLEAKKELRKRLRGLRRALSPDGARARSSALVARVVAHPLFVDAHTIAVFYPMEARREVELRPLVDVARAAGKLIACPWIGDGTSPACFREVASTEALVTTPIGALEPSADAPVVADDARLLILVPALAVDLDGRRLGYGGGYYDRLLSSHPLASSIAVVFDFQILAEIPTLAHDVCVQHVASDTRLVRAGAQGVMVAPTATSEVTEPGVRRILRPS